MKATPPIISGPKGAEIISWTVTMTLAEFQAGQRRLREAERLSPRQQKQLELRRLEAWFKRQSRLPGGPATRSLGKPLPSSHAREAGKATAQVNAGGSK